MMNYKVQSARVCVCVCVCVLRHVSADGYLYLLNTVVTRSNALADCPLGTRYVNTFIPKVHYNLDYHS